MPHASLELYADVRFASPYVMSVMVTLHEKQLPYKLVTVDLAGGASREPGYTALSLTQRVPTLVHGDFALSESSAITEYLEDIFPQTPVYPREPQLRARARQIQAWLRSDLAAIREQRSSELFFYRAPKAALDKQGTQAAERLIAVAQTLLAGASANLCGQWCIADTDLALMLNRLILNGDPVPRKLMDYAQRQWQRPSLQHWLNQQRQSS